MLDGTTASAFLSFPSTYSMFMFIKFVVNSICSLAMLHIACRIKKKANNYFSKNENEKIAGGMLLLLFFHVNSLNGTIDLQFDEHVEYGAIFFSHLCSTFISLQ